MGAPDASAGDQQPLPRPVLATPVWRDAALAWLSNAFEYVQRHRRLAAFVTAAVLITLAGFAGLALGRRSTAPVIAPVEDIYPRLDPAVLEPATGGAGPVETTVVVHVAGAVAAPGVYVLEPASRVDDAIGAAGGPLPDGDLDRLNLASPVIDGSRVFVPIVGEPVPLPLDPVVGDAGASGAGPLDLNTVDAVALDALPGIGPAIAATIVAHRDEHGPFASIDELLEVAGVGPAKLAALEGLVRVS